MEDVVLEDNLQASKSQRFQIGIFNKEPLHNKEMA